MDYVKKMLEWRFVSKYVRLNIFVFIVAACMLYSPATLRADQFFEEFLGDDDYFDVLEGYQAEFIFNLTTTGETATLFDASGDAVDGSEGLFPTTDEQDFVQGAYQINSASLGFTFSSTDMWAEEITIHSGFYDGDLLIGKYSYTLGNIWSQFITGEPSYADLTIDLLTIELSNEDTDENVGLLEYLEDGRFVTLVFALEYGGNCDPENDFTIDTASLTLEATPVPIPAGIWMLGSGLIGLTSIRRKIKK